jgi:hypothetical protein
MQLLDTNYPARPKDGWRMNSQPCEMCSIHVEPPWLHMWASMGVSAGKSCQPHVDLACSNWIFWHCILWKGSRGRSVSNRTIAGTLSNYCAYLMAFVPELLPGHQLSTRKLFNKVWHEALNNSNEKHSREGWIQPWPRKCNNCTNRAIKKPSCNFEILTEILQTQL